MASPPPTDTHISQQSKKRVFPESSSSYVDPEVVGLEISPSMSRSSKSNSLKQKEVIHHEVIDIDMDEDSGDVMLLDEKVDTHNKGKEALANFSYSHGNSEKPESVDGVQSSKGCSLPGLHNSFNNEFSYAGDDYSDMYHAFLEAHFNSNDIPPGVEAPIPSFSDPSQNKKNPATVISSNHSSSSIQFDAPGIVSSHPWGLPELAQTGQKLTSMSSSSLQTHMDTLDLSSSWPFPESSRNKMKLAASTSSANWILQAEKGATNHPTEFKSYSIPGFSRSKKNPAASGMDPSFGEFYLHNRRKKPVGNGSLTYSWFSAMDKMNLSPGVDAHMSEWQGSPAFMDNSSFMSDMNDGIYDSFDDAHLFSEKEVYTAWCQDLANSQKSATAAGSSTFVFGSTSGIGKHGNENDILTKFQSFKQFDIVQDHSDHHYSCKGFSVIEPSWAKKIQDEWKILEKDLPDKIFVRVYESRMDLLRAVIVGAEGTPYHDGLFFFDVFFPCGYPIVPPHVYYHSGGLRINPNLYHCGKVCLSLLNTWSGNNQNEQWIPGVSTMLQVLVSIQALILNEKPYFNEPGFEIMDGSASGEKNSQQYNENTFILSLRTMVYIMRRPPKHFEDFVVGHFFKRAKDILMACNAYIEGAQVGCVVKGGVQDVDAGDKSCSQHFKDSLAGFITVLVQTFSQTGAKDCEKFLSLAEKGSNPVSSVPMAFNFFDPMEPMDMDMQF